MALRTGQVSTVVRRFLSVVAGATLACAEASGPATHDHSQRLLIAGTESGSLVVDFDWGGVIRAMGPAFVSQGPSALDLQNRLVTIGVLASNDRVIVALDALTGVELWRQTIAIGSTGVTLDGVQLGGAAMAVHPTRPEVYLWRSSMDGGFGVAALDVVRKRVTGFIGPVTARFRGLVATPPSAEHAGGCLVLGLDAGPPSASRAFLHVVCDGDYAARDSIPIGDPSRFVEQVGLTADGSAIHVMTNLEFLKYDAATFALTARAARPLDAPFFLTRNRGRLIVPDVGNSVVASTGIIYILDSSLELAAVIDLRILPFGDRPLGILGVEESADGRWLYVVGGVARDGPTYGPEQTHVLVIDQHTGDVTNVVRLKTFGGGGPFVIP